MLHGILLDRVVNQRLDRLVHNQACLDVFRLVLRLQTRMTINRPACRGLVMSALSDAKGKVYCAAVGCSNRGSCCSLDLLG